MRSDIIASTSTWPSGTQALTAEGRLVSCALFVVSIAALCAAAIWNGYPLVFPDTAAYIASAERLVAPVGRPITYGLFVRVLGANWSLWLPIVAQSAVLAWLVRRAFRTVAPQAPAHSATALLCLLSFTTALSVTASQLLPDVFTPIAILSLALLSRQEEMPWIEQVALGFALAIAVASHTSNLPTAGVTLAGLAFWGATRPAGVRRRSLRRLRVSAVAVVVGGMLVPTTNAIWGRGFHFSEGTAAFLTARIAETGALEPYLDARCEERPNPLCAVRDQIPATSSAFLWKRDSAFRTLGSFSVASARLQPLVNDFFRQPRFIAQFALDGFASGLVCLAHFDIEHENVRPQGPGSPPHEIVAHYFPSELRRYVGARQQRDALGRFAALNLCQEGLVFLGALSLLLLGRRFSTRIPSAGRCVVFVALVAIVMNAFVCGALSTPTDARYSARVIWLVPMLAAASALQYWRSVRAEPIPRDHTRAG